MKRFNMKSEILKLAGQYRKIGERKLEIIEILLKKQAEFSRITGREIKRIYINQYKIAEEVGISQSKISLNLKGLESLGILKISKRMRKGAIHPHTVITFNPIEEIKLNLEANLERKKRKIVKLPPELKNIYIVTRDSRKICEKKLELMEYLLKKHANSPLTEEIHITLAELEEPLGITLSTAAFHLKRLESLGILKTRKGRNKGAMCTVITFNPIEEIIRNLLPHLYINKVEDWPPELKNTYMSVSDAKSLGENKPNDIVISDNNFIEEIIRILLPHWYINKVEDWPPPELKNYMSVSDWLPPEFNNTMGVSDAKSLGKNKTENIISYGNNIFLSKGEEKIENSSKECKNGIELEGDMETIKTIKTIKTNTTQPTTKSPPMRKFTMEECDFVYKRTIEEVKKITTLDVPIENSKLKSYIVHQFKKFGENWDKFLGYLRKKLKKGGKGIHSIVAVLLHVFSFQNINAYLAELRNKPQVQEVQNDQQNSAKVEEYKDVQIANDSSLAEAIQTKTGLDIDLCEQAAKTLQYLSDEISHLEDCKKQQIAEIREKNPAFVVTDPSTHSSSFNEYNLIKSLIPLLEAKKAIYQRKKKNIFSGEWFVDNPYLIRKPREDGMPLDIIGHTIEDEHVPR